MTDRYRAAGLERNPFLAEQQPGAAPEVWIDRGLPQPTWRAGHLVQVIGPRGSGKTCHLLRWKVALAGPYVHVGSGLRRWRALPVGSVVYWDEADRAMRLLPALGRLAHIGGMAVVGTHRDLSAAGSRLGLSTETHVLGDLDAADVRAFARARIRAADGNPDDWVDLPFQSAAAAAHGSLREAGRLLHIAVARRVADRAHASLAPK